VRANSSSRGAVGEEEVKWVGISVRYRKFLRLYVYCSWSEEAQGRIAELQAGSQIHSVQRPNTRYSQKVEMRLIFSLVIWPLWNFSHSSTDARAVLRQSIAILSITTPLLNIYGGWRNKPMVQYLISERDNYSAVQGRHCCHIIHVVVRYYLLRNCYHPRNIIQVWFIFAVISRKWCDASCWGPIVVVEPLSLPGTETGILIVSWFSSVSPDKLRGSALK
jgi:hypothetical protein